MRYFVAVLLFSSSFYLSCELASANNETQSLERLQQLVTDPSQAKEMRRKIKSASKKELAQFAELNKVIEKEIATISSSLPRKVDKYTTWDSATISGENIAFKYTLSTEMASIDRRNQVMAELNKMLKKGFCTSPSGAWLILGYTWSYFYYHEDGSYYGGVIIDAKKCGFE